MLAESEQPGKNPPRRAHPRPLAPTPRPPPPPDADRFARATLDQLSAHIAVVNQDGVIVSVNQPWRDFAAANGPLPGSICERANYLEVLAAAQGDDRPAALAFASALRDVLAGRRDYFELDYPCPAPGQPRWFIGRIRPLPTHGPLHAIVSHQDITARKQAELALERSQAELRAIYDHAPVLLCVLDPRRHVLYANRAFTDFTGVSAVGGCACGIFGCINALDDPQGCGFGPQCADCPLRLAIEDTLQTGRGHQNIEYRATLERQGIRQYVVMLGATALIPTPAQPALLLCLQDVTQREWAKEARDKIAADLNAAQRLAHLGSWQWNLLDDTALWSEETYRIFGLPFVPLARHGIHFVSLIHTDDQARVGQALADAIAKNTPYDLEYRIRHPDGRERIIHAQGEVLRRDDGTPVTFRGTVQDITRRKHLVDALRRTAASLAEAQTLSQVGSWRIVFHDGAESWICSDEFLRIWGFPLGSAVATTDIMGRLHPDDRPATAAAWSAAFTAGGSLEWDHRILVDGQVKWIHLRLRVRHDDQGRPLEATGTNQDITERREAQDVLRHSEQKFRRLYETMRDAFVVTDMAGMIQEFNPAFQRMLGYSAAELHTLSYKDITPERWHEVETNLVRDQLLPQGFTDVYEKEYRRKDGTIVPVELRTSLLCDDSGRSVAMWAIVRDLTERRHAEAKLATQQAALAHLSRVVTLGELTAGLAHEINQPLAASLLYAETCRDLLKTGVMEPAEMAAALRHLIEQLERVRATVVHLRMFMRKQPLACSTLDLNQALKDSAALLAHTLHQAGVHLVWELAPRPPLVNADPVLIQQVVINLVMNALEAMAAPGDRPRHLTLKTLTAAADGTCTVSIGDTGPGVPPALAHRLFDSFVSGKPQGLGLGLAISRSIIEQHQGRIWHEPAPAGGAWFKFMLPASSGNMGVSP